ncbi:MmgE/PrpD family protein [Streptomyces sp. NPDC127084]|uniref:MmgE/PrpD family protein n=1 Tax=Streptomyces sp. NPDC127084 TaxID=3347133 RepID=UPI00364C2517
MAAPANALEPKPTVVEEIAAYAHRARYEDLSKTSIEQLPTHILDCVACSIAALGATPVNACREQVREFADGGACRLIGGGTSNPVYASFWHTALVRYVDIMENFLAPTETCHTADNFGGVLTAADLADASGRELMLGLAVSYTIQSRLVDHANFMTRGFDHTAQLAFSVPAAAGRLLGMEAEQLAHAMAMAGASGASFANIRAKPLSQWKGLASAQSALGAMNALFLARRGIEGPLAIVEGPNGIDNLLHRPIVVDWANEKYEGIVTSAIKRYNAEIHTQSAIHCMVELRGRQPLDPAQIVSIEAVVPQITFDFTGGGLYGGAATTVTTKEQADHSLPYLLAVALLDGDVMPAQFLPERITRDDVQQLLSKVVVKPGHDFTRAYPELMPAHITVRLQDGTVLTHGVDDYPGLPSRPFTWDDAAGKYDRLVAGKVDPGLAGEIKDVIRNIAGSTTRDLTGLLARVPYPAAT